MVFVRDGRTVAHGRILAANWGHLTLSPALLSRYLLDLPATYTTGGIVLPYVDAHLACTRTEPQPFQAALLNHQCENPTCCAQWWWSARRLWWSAPGPPSAAALSSRTTTTPTKPLGPIPSAPRMPSCPSSPANTRPRASAHPLAPARVAVTCPEVWPPLLPPCMDDLPPPL